MIDRQMYEVKLATEVLASMSQPVIHRDGDAVPACAGGASAEVGRGSRAEP